MIARNATKGRIIATDVNVARNIVSRMIGLLGRSGLSSSEGLWIYPCRSIHTFFMRFPIDVVFLSSEHKVVWTLGAVSPFRISPWIHQARSVLELTSGTVEKSETVVGDQIVFEG